MVQSGQPHWHYNQYSQLMEMVALEHCLKKWTQNLRTSLSLQEEIKGLREEVTESKTKFIELDTKVTEIEKSIEFNSKTCEDKAVAQTDSLNKVKAELEGKVQELENKLLLQEKQDRKNNFLFYGITEEPNEDIEDKLKNIFLKDLKLDYGRVSNMYFAHGHRIPTKSPGPKPIIEICPIL